MVEAHEVDVALEPRHRDAMLEFILAWASLDGALGMMLSTSLGVNFARGARLLLKEPASARFAAMRRLMQATPNGEEAARKIKKYKRKYERYSKLRNIIAHSHCGGVWTRDRDYIVFATFEAVSDDELGIDAIPIDEMVRATVWGREMAKVALSIADLPLSHPE